eukprot:g75307.t1
MKISPSSSRVVNFGFVSSHRQTNKHRVPVNAKKAVHSSILPSDPVMPATSLLSAWQEEAGVNKQTTKRRILVIGAGPSGLVAVKTLREHGFDALAVEQSNKIGGTFANKTYDDGRLVSSRFITPFSDFRMPADSTDDHPTVERWLAYLNDYCDQFQLWPFISFDTRVVELKKSTLCNKEVKGAWKFKYSVRLEHAGAAQGSFGSQVQCDAVAICSGLHNIPAVPDLSGLVEALQKGPVGENLCEVQAKPRDADKTATKKAVFQGLVLHSAHYRTRSVFRGKRVLIVGCGETGMDISYRAVLAKAQSVTMAVRNGFLSVPTVLKHGVPLDSFITNLFECAYQHPWTEYMKLRWRIITFGIRFGFLVATGSSSGFNQWTGTLPDVRRGKYIINKSADAMPYINRPMKRKAGLLGRIYSWWDSDADPALPDIEVIRAAPLRAIGPSQIAFSDGVARDFDVVVLATGYKQRFPFLYPDSGDKVGAGVNGDHPLPSQRNICSSEEPTLGFFGFIRPNVGAIPPMAELQLLWWIYMLRGGPLGSLEPPQYLLLGHNPRTYTYAVDYGSYMHDLARDIGAVPTIWLWLWRDWRVAVAYAFGQAYVTFFRLEGPFALPDAPRISRQELFRPVVDRPFSSNLLFFILMLVFGSINIYFYFVDKLFWTPLRSAISFVFYPVRSFVSLDLFGSKQPMPTCHNGHISQKAIKSLNGTYAKTKEF